VLTRESYRGLFAYPPTPYRPDLSLDEEGLRRNLRKLIRIGVDGIVMAGTSGEFYTLTDPEYRRLAEILREETMAGGVAAVLGTTGLSTRAAIERSTMAMDIGMDAVLVVAPFYVPLTPSELVKFWTDLCIACPATGVIVYNYDWMRQEYTPEMFRELQHLPNFLGSKEAHWNFGKWLTMHRESPLVHMSSTDAGWLVELYRQGAVGVGSLQICYMPHIVRQVLQFCGQKRFIEAEQALVPFTEFIARMKMGQGQPHVFPSDLPGWADYSHLARHKAMTDAFGFLRVGPPRPPAIPIPAELQTRLREFLEQRYANLLPPANYEDMIEPGSRVWPTSVAAGTV
jgi:4-hydroxy-tetrahydrodipicolinate synthase